MFNGPVSGEKTTDAADSTFACGRGEAAGARPAGAGDVDGDGYDDILIDAPASDDGGRNAGAVYLFRGPLTASVELGTADAKLYGTVVDGYAGYDVCGAGDVDGDGFADILVGAPDYVGRDDGAGTTYLVRGPVRVNHQRTPNTAA